MNNILHSLKNVFAAFLLISMISLPSNIFSFAYIFAGETNGVDVVTHPIGYDGTGGVLNLTVGIDPTSANAANMVIPTQNVVAIWNAMMASNGNLLFGTENNIPVGMNDFESTLLHEVGHSLGLAHVNAATESGLGGANRNYTKATDGADNMFNLNPGADGVIGSADDVRGDDVNLNYFRISNNNPFGIAGIVDQTTYSRDVANLPGPDLFSTNGDRTVSTLLGLPATEATMQQGQGSDEDQRTLGFDDVAGIRYAMTGLDETAGTADDYTITLTYAGQTTMADIVIDFDNTQTGFAVSQNSGNFLNATHVVITNTAIFFNTGGNYFFSQVPFVACNAPSITCPADNFNLAPGCNPSVPAAATNFNDVNAPDADPAQPTVSGGCLPLTLTSSDMTVDVGCMRTVSRTYTITDGNGDSDQCTQTFSFTVDTDPPTFNEMLPMDMTVECDAIPAPAMLTATDNCAPMAMPTLVPFIFINEIHYDNFGTDVGEFIEVVGTAGFDLSNCEIVLYNGNGNDPYNTMSLSGMIDDEGAGIGAVSFSYPTNGIQNGSPDGIALVCDGAVVEFLSYEGTMTAVGGPADGLTSIDIGVSEPGQVGESLQRTGTGCLPGDFTWVGPTDIMESPGSINAGQTFSGCATNDPPAAPFVRITEIHYDNTGADAGEFVEISGTAGFDLSTCSLEFYNGSTGDSYGTLNLSGTIDDEVNGYGAVSFPRAGIQNGSPDGVALICNGAVVQFLSYEGSFTANDGPAMGMSSTDIGVSEPSSTPIGESLQLTGTGCDAMTLNWTGPLAESPGDLNAGLTFSGCPAVMGNLMVDFMETETPAGTCPQERTITRTWTVDDACGNIASHTQTIVVEDNTPPVFVCPPEDTLVDCDVVPPVPVVTAIDACESPNTVWVNEFHYDNSGTDQGEFIEVAGVAGVDLTGYSLVLYNGANGTVFNTIQLSGILPNDSDCGFGAISFDAIGLMNGSPDGFVLIDPSGAIIEFLSYEGSFTATNGPAAGLTSTDVGVSEGSGTPVGQSLQRTGNGASGPDFTWTGPLEESRDALNEGQMVEGPIIASFEGEVRTDGNCPFNYTLTRTWEAEDACGNSDQHVQVITVQDTTPPMAVCQDITVELDRDGMASITPDMIDGGSTDNCSATADLTLMASQLNFTCADLNQNGTPGCATPIPVTLSVTDECGNTGTCVATVTLVDNIAPVLSCNNDLTITLDPGLCRTTFRPITIATDNCDTDVTISQIEGPVRGEFLEKDSTYTYTFEAEDNCSNTTQCTFTVTVEENMDPITNLQCNDLINVTLDTLCEAVISPDDVLEGDNFGCYEDYVVDLFYDQALTQPIPTSPAVTSTEVGRIIYTRVTDPETGVSCWGTALIEDKTPPRLDCPCQQGGTPVTSVSGSLDDTDPMFSRPNDIGMNPGNCTPQAAQYFYDRFDFTIDQADVYTFSMPSIIGPDFFFALYSGGFDPAQPCNNLLATDDDSNGTEPEITIQLTLTPGNYTLVTTTFFANDPDGAYAYTISSNGGGQVLQRDADCFLKCFDDLSNLPDPVATDACGVVSLISTDQFIDGGDCGNSTLLRTWTATDVGGNTTSCTQEFTIEPATLADVTPPPNYDGIDGRPTLLCENRCDNKPNNLCTTPANATYWNVIPDGQPYAGHPSPDPNTDGCASGLVQCFGTGRPNAGTMCGNIQSTFADTRLNVCTTGPSEGCYKILRRWTVLDWCTGEVANFNQVIKVEDNEGPQIADVADLTVSVDVWGCEANWLATEPWLMDNCSSEPLDYTVSSTGGTVQALPDGRYRILGLTPGQYDVTYSASDCCGNVTDSTITLTVVDDVAPVTVCDGHTVVSISRTTNINDENLGLTKIFASTFDDGSYDNCSDQVWFKAMRMDEYDSNGNGKFPETVRDGDWASIDCDAANGDDDLRTRPSFYNGPQSYFDDYVKFCCEDITDGPIMVVFRVYDVDPEPFTFGRQFPQLVPAGEDPDDYNGVLPELQDVGGPLYGRYDDCMVEVSVQDKLPPYVVAPPNITVTCDYWFPFDADNPNDYTDELDAIFGKVVEGSADPADRDSIVITDRVCPAHPRFAEFAPANPIDDQCYDDKYDIFWGFDGYVLDNCSIELEQTIVPDLHCGRGDIIRSWRAGDDAGNWSNIARQRITIIDCKEFFVPTVCWRFTQKDIGECVRLAADDYRVQLIEWPCDVEISRCQTDGADAFLPDNLPIPFDQDRRPRYDDDNCNLLGATYEDRTFTFVDNACVKIFRDWTVIDWCLYEDGVTPYEWHFTQVIKLLNTEGPTFDDCEDKEFCGFGDPAFPNNNQCVGEVTLEPIISDDCTDTVRILSDYKIDAFNDGTYDILGYSRNHPVNPFGIGVSARVYDPASPNANGKYPVGEHRILWTAEDGCGNITACEYLFTVRDCKPPTPYCRNGVSTIPMPQDAGGYVDIWASDYNIGSYDNCTAQDDLIYSFSDDPTDNSRRFFCADAPGIYDLTVYVWDLGLDGLPRNFATCEVTIQLTDCGNQTMYHVAGTIENEVGEFASDVTVSITGDDNASMLTDNSGIYDFELMENRNYVVTPEKDLDHRNGVSTFDLVLISKHITGQQSLNSPYKMIAADVNKTGSITTFDIIELRKLILYINTEFPDNTSWRFVDEAFQFVDPTNPFVSNFPEVYNINGLDRDMDINFVAIKVGDVNDSANPNNLVGNSQTRSAGELNFEVKDQLLNAGASYTVDFTAADFTNILGYQFTLNYSDAVEVSEVRGGALDLNEGNFGELNGAITTSWNAAKAANLSADEVVFSLTLTAKDPIAIGLKLSDVLSISSDYTTAEAYNGAGMLNVALNFNTVEKTDAFALYQNQPNPFTANTVIGFNLPQAGAATLSIYDVAGKVLRVVEGEYSKGYNEITVNRSELSGAGVLYYTLETQQERATKKMILIK